MVLAPRHTLRRKINIDSADQRRVGKMPLGPNHNLESVDFRRRLDADFLDVLPCSKIGLDCLTTIKDAGGSNASSKGHQKLFVQNRILRKSTNPCDRTIKRAHNGDDDSKDSFPGFYSC